MSRAGTAIIFAVERDATAPLPTRKVGLARALSKAGFCSRCAAADLILSGRVRVNGAVRRNVEAPVHLGKDRLEVDGKKIPDTAKIYLMLNKPRGAVTTASDERGRETIYKYLNKNIPWVAPVGRLDKASEGLLLITNDSEWAASITQPEMHVDKTYHLQLAAILTDEIIAGLMHGVPAKDGEFLRVKSARLLRSGQRNCWLEIVLDEGKNRHLRRTFESLGVEVLRLIRVAIGDLTLGDLAKGRTRELTEAERMLLFRKTTAL